MKTYLKPIDVISFGKYRGRTIKEVIEVDPSYLIWAGSNVSGFVLSPDLLQMARDNKAEQEADSYEGMLDWWDVM